MKKVYKIHKKESLTENLRRVLPEMFDGFFVWKKDVAGYPLRKVHLHEMRKAGKPLRYAMELGEYCFGEEFKKCLGEVKDVLELMGDVHDADVMIPELQGYLNEIRQFNNTIEEADMRISTAGLRTNISSLRIARKAQFAELNEKLNRWEVSGFKERMIGSMNLQVEEEIQTG
jgi:CHAD domain-containing protein